MFICLFLSLLDGSDTVCVCEIEREIVRETVSKRNPEIQPELSVAEFKARARVTGQRVMRRGGGRQSG